MQYLFELGHQPHISIQEIFSLLHERDLSFGVIEETDAFLLIESHDPLPTKDLQFFLGGSLSIGRELIPQKEGIDTVVQFLLENQSGKIQFCIASKNKKHGLEIKKKLKELGKSVRYIEYKNTATILHNNLIEKKGYFREYNGAFYTIEAIQDLEAFAERDFDKPGVDAKSGMLPPKLARMIINLAEKNPEESTLLDPFCGSGVLLMEAYDLGYKEIIGTDISSKAIEDAEKNMQWIVEKEQKEDTKDITLHIEDVKDLTESVEKNSIDLIVTEPYMGKPLWGTEKSEQLETQAQELSQLYIIAFREFHKILKDDGIIIFIIPQFQYKNDWIHIDCIDNIEKQGFHTVPFSEEHESLLYARENQHVGRRIWKFQKK